MRGFPLLFVLVLACSGHGAGSAPAPHAAPRVAPSAPPGTVRVVITGVVAPSPGQARDALEICPAAYVRPCSGVQLVGELAPDFVSTAERVKVVRLWGRYDGARLELDGRAELLPPRVPEADYRNPCPQYQDEPPGEEDASTPLSGLANYLVREHPGRHAATHWDRARQTLTVQFTGDVSALAAKVKATRSDRLCLIGGARRSLDDLRRLRNAVMALVDRRNGWLVGVDVDMLANSLAVRIENVDAALLADVRDAAGPEARITSFIELLDGSIDELPEPPARGDIQLVTRPRRWDEGPWYGALGLFVIRLDVAARCVYFEAPEGERLVPIWPQGYAAYAEPFRVVDFDDRPVSQTPQQQQQFGGATIPMEHLRSPPANACGAKSSWSVTPEL
jgi:hypothetical protein